jgi:hypothetical protein
MNKLLEKIKKGQWVLVVIVALVLVYLGVGVAKDKIAANSFFNKFDVLTVSGEGMFSYNKILLNGKVVKETKEDWTNVLPVPNSLQYVLLTSSYSKGHSIQCGNATIPKRVEAANLGENEWCITNNGKDFVSVASAQYYPYDTTSTVYETCLKSGYYEGVNGGQGFNSCAERGLFLNDKQIASTKEKIGTNYLTNKSRLEDASTFNYSPSKRLGNTIIYSTTDGTFAYDTTTEKTTQLADNENTKLEDIFLTDDGKTIAVESSGEMTKELSAFLGKVNYGSQIFNNIYSANYADGHFYMLRFSDVRDREKGSNLSKVFTYELLRDGKKIENIEVESISPFGYNNDAIQKFPLCKTDSLVCLYEDGHYAYKNRTLVPEVYGYDFYAEEMVIDGEWRGDNIPNFIGRSKPIFENGKLKYLVYAAFPDKGLYLIDFDKKWSFKDLYFKSGSATTKLLGDYQNALLNVMKK